MGFFSWALTGSKRNYAAYEVKFYVVVRAVEHFKGFLLSTEFILRTDHAAFRNLLGRDMPPTTRVKRWILRLSEYNFKIKYQRGKENIISDVLCRLPHVNSENVEKSTNLDSRMRLEKLTSPNQKLVE